MEKLNDNFGGQAEYNAIDFVKFIMALVVVAIHTEPFHGSSEIYRCYLIHFQD